MTEAIEVTQEINSTGIIPLEALRTQPRKGLTKVMILVVIEVVVMVVGVVVVPVVPLEVN